MITATTAPPTHPKRGVRRDVGIWAGLLQEVLFSNDQNRAELRVLGFDICYDEEIS